MAKISLLSPVWNEERHIDAMVQSVVAQTHTDWELLVVDDGSTDRTPDLLATWRERDSRIKIVGSGEKLGKCAAFNMAFKASTGDVICLLAGDDVLPPHSLSSRAAVLGEHTEVPAVGFFKIKTFSEQRRFDGAVLPRGSRGSRSGGSMTLTRPLAEIVFPIPEGLPAEDIWLSHAIEAVTSIVFDNPAIVLNYRIHAGNSNPRHRPFKELNESLHRRNEALNELLEQSRFPLSEGVRRNLELLAHAEQLRHAGRTIAILRLSPLSWTDRLGIAQASRPALRWARDRVYLIASGWRGR